LALVLLPAGYQAEMSRQAAKPGRVRLPHHGGLDGLRGLAVVAVIMYHSGVSWAGGGFLGVEVFFVLSGFLITSLLLSEFLGSSTIAFRAFWARRARRLLPALFGLVVAIGIYYAIAGPTKAVPGLQGDGIATLLYYSNWHQIAAGTNYFAASGPVSPLQHTWSLAIEEQFYILWPILLFGVLWLTRRRGGLSERRSLQVLLGVTITGAVASAVDMALLFDGGRGLDRVYYGTDTRAASLLVGASLAIGLSLVRRRPAPADRSEPSRARARAVSSGSVLALAAVVVTCGLAEGSAAWLYPYGLVAIDAAVVILILAAVRSPASLAARALSVRPLRALGQISYGLYLWHFPLFLWLDESSTGLSGARLVVLRLAATLLISVVSYVAIEQPIRRRRRPTWLVRGLAPLAAGAALASLLLASAADSLPVGVPAAATVPQPPAQLRGADPACQTQRTRPACQGSRGRARIPRRVRLALERPRRPSRPAGV
jgi:peptidoglycan/LPS O-acetylase OafA/YrhL